MKIITYCIFRFSNYIHIPMEQLNPKAIGQISQILLILLYKSGENHENSK